MGKRSFFTGGLHKEANHALTMLEIISNISIPSPLNSPDICSFLRYFFIQTLTYPQLFRLLRQSVFFASDTVTNYKSSPIIEQQCSVAIASHVTNFYDWCY